LVLRGEVRRKFHGGEEGFQLGELEVVHLEAEGVEVGGLVFATLSVSNSASTPYSSQTKRKKASATGRVFSKS
jgi:hypothetical protein